MEDFLSSLAKGAGVELAFFGTFLDTATPLNRIRAKIRAAGGADCDHGRKMASCPCCAERRRRDNERYGRRIEFDSASDNSDVAMTDEPKYPERYYEYLAEL